METENRSVVIMSPGLNTDLLLISSIRTEGLCLQAESQQAGGEPGQLRRR
jgi:hypothetical protein